MTDIEKRLAAIERRLEWCPGLGSWIIDIAFSTWIGLAVWVLWDERRERKTQEIKAEQSK